MTNSKTFRSGHLVILVVLTHLLLALAVWANTKMTELIVGDSVSYERLANALLKYGEFSREISEPFTWEAYRTPGYPVLLAFCIGVLGDFRFVMIVHALLAGLAAPCLIQLGKEIGLSSKQINFSLLLFAFLPNSLGLCGMILTDAPSAYLTVIVTGLFITGVRNDSALLLTIAMGCLAVNQLIRPNLAYIGPVLGVLVFILNNSIPRYRKIVLSVSIVIASAIIPGVLSMKMKHEHGEFTVSMKGVETIRYYFVAADSASRAGSDFSVVSKGIKSHDNAKAQASMDGSTHEQKLFRVQHSEIREYVSRTPSAIFFQPARELVRQAFAPQEFVFSAFGIRSLPMRIIGFVINLVLFMSAVVGLVFLFQKNGRLCFAILLLVAYLMLLNLLSHRVGGRLRLPIDLLFLPFAAFGFTQLMDFNYKSLWSR